MGKGLERTEGTGASVAVLEMHLKCTAPILMNLILFRVFRFDGFSMGNKGVRRKVVVT